MLSMLVSVSDTCQRIVSDTNTYSFTHIELSDILKLLMVLMPVSVCAYLYFHSMIVTLDACCYFIEFRCVCTFSFVILTEIRF